MEDPKSHEEPTPEKDPVKKKDRLSRLTKKRLRQGGLAFGFVVITLVGWWVFASLAETVVRCIPWQYGDGCEDLFTSRPRLNIAVRISLLIVSLFAAIWVAFKLFFTAESFEPSDTASAATK